MSPSADAASDVKQMAQINALTGLLPRDHHHPARYQVLFEQPRLRQTPRVP
jgi:hypothetical protein